jgi:drug/metabolite transporter (DMT)-like permease
MAQEHVPGNAPALPRRHGGRRRAAWQVLALTALALACFAANSLLARLALREQGMDPLGFTLVRLASGAAMLALLVRWRRRSRPVAGDWGSALALFGYALAFSLAYVHVTAGTGALLLFGAVQLTMVGLALNAGERWTPLQAAGSALALAGLGWLVWPGFAAPPLAPATAMVFAGMAWGVYSWRGRGVLDPLRSTAGNFYRAAPLALLPCLLLLPTLRPDPFGAACAVLSGAIASGLGYAIWYAALPGLGAKTAANAQLSVPVLTAFGGVVLLGEPIGWRLVVAGAAVLGGIALAARARGRQSR